MLPRRRNRIDANVPLKLRELLNEVDTAGNIVKLSDLTVNLIPLVLPVPSHQVELELKALTGDFG
jgi:hypothetical protein